MAPAALPPAVLPLFKAALNADSVLSDAQDLDFFGKDSLKQFAAAPSLILLPRTTEEISRVIAICNQHNVAIVPSGGRTGYSGGATASNGEVILSLQRMNRVLALNPVERSMHCQAGVTTEAIQDKAREAQLFYPVDFPSRGSSCIGGNVATNAGGVRVVRYGSTREWILGLTVVTGAGEVLNLNGSLYKNQSGYDLRSLMIGSEGTLGVITEVIVRLTTAPLSSSFALCAIAGTAQALELMRQMRSAGLVINLIEYFERDALDLVIEHAGLSDPFKSKYPAYLALEVETAGQAELERFHVELANALESGKVSDTAIAQSSQQAAQLLALRERISESLNKAHVPHKNDIALPLSQVPAFVTKLREIQGSWPEKFEIVVFGHIGDGNLHLNVLKPEKMSQEQFFESCAALDHKIFAAVQQHSGTISAEHGIGLLKKPYLHYTRAPTEIALMKQLKAVLDPRGILNPGKIFD